MRITPRVYRDAAFLNVCVSGEVGSPRGNPKVERGNAKVVLVAGNGGRAHAAEIGKLYRAGIGKSEIARRLQIGRTSVRRVLGPKR